jgi:hypothetical protein
MMPANERTAVEFTLSEGQLHDAPQGRMLMETVGKRKGRFIPLAMDRMRTTTPDTQLKHWVFSLSFRLRKTAGILGNTTRISTKDATKLKDCSD